jgi:hypothetical protein
MGRVAQEGLKLVDAAATAAMLQLSYRKGEAYVAALSAGGQAGNEARPCGSALKPKSR